ncbi:MAG: excisionase family DNA-binding protein [Burkholderiaceae bacterium]
MSAAVDMERLVPPPLNEVETEMVKSAERIIMAAIDHSRAATITIQSDDGSTPSVQVPPQVLRVLGQALGLMTRHQAIMLVPEKQEFSTVEAANFLNVSRPFVIKEIEAGRIKHRLVGTHRRILFSDLMSYAKAMRTGQQEALDEMADNARKLGLKY